MDTVTSQAFAIDQLETIDFGDGFQKQYSTIPWKVNMTVLGVLEAAAKHPRPIRFRHRSSGETAFLEQIDDLKNEGGDGRNWIYRVNGKLYAVKVTPPHGVPYFLMDDIGDGTMSRRDSLDSGLRVPQWVLLEF